MNESPVTTETVLSVSSIYKWRNWIIVVLILWMISVIIVRYLVPNEKVKDEIEKTNTFLFGTSGMIPIIYTVWVSSLLFIVIVPAIISVMPKVDKFLANINKVTNTFISS